MKNILMLNTLFMPPDGDETSPVFFECTVYNTDNLYEVNVSDTSKVDIEYTGIQQYLEQNNLIAGNFYFNSEGLKPLSPYFTVSETYRPMSNSITAENVKPALTVAKILAKLCNTDSIIKFNPDFYRDVTGNESFEKFSPSFENAVIHANKLTISSKKFNIVLTSVIPGLVDLHGLPNPVHRFYPFKLVKFGQLKYDYIDVLPNTANSILLSEIGTKQLDGYYRVDLTKYPVFADKLNLVNANTLTELASEISYAKSVIKGMSFYRSKLKTSLIQIDKENDLVTDWLRGDPLDDSIVADAGTETLEFWIKGNKASISATKLLEETGDFGNKLSEFVNKLADLADVPQELITNPVMSMSKPLQEMFSRNLIKIDEMFLLGAILEGMLTVGNKRERFDTLSVNLKQQSKALTKLEMLSLEIRWSLLQASQEQPLETFDLLKTIGTFNRGQNANVAHISLDVYGFKPVTIKKGKIEGGNETPNYNPSSVNVYITSDIKGVDNYGNI